TLATGGGASSFGGALTVTGLTSTNGGIADAGNITQTSGTAQFLNTQVNGTLGSTGSATLATGGGASSFGGDLTVTGLTTTNGGIQDNGTLTQNGTITQTSGGPNTLLATNFGANNVTGSDFNITGSTINGTTVGVTTPAAADFTSIGLVTPGTGKFTTLESTGNSLIGDGALATTNSFGTAGNGAIATNTIGSNMAGSATNFNGVVTMSGTNQATDELTITNVAPGTWGERVTASPASGSALGVIGNASSTVGNVARGGQFGATGGGTQNIGVLGNASGATGSNVALSATASGTNSFGLFVNAGAVTGINVDASSGSTGNGILVSGVSTNANGLSITLNGGGVSNTNSINVDMANATGGGSNGFRIQNLNNATNHGLDITMSAGTGINETMSANGTAMQVNSLAAAQGISLQGLSSGTGINIAGPTGSGTALNITAPSSASGATGIRVAGDGSTSTTAIEVNNGNVKATGANQFAATYALTGLDQAGTSFSISNALVVPSSTIIITGMSNGGTVGIMTVSAVAAGNFTVSTSAIDFTAINDIYYEIINH
ncbi:MAG TPA: hypothetical protein VFD13_00705, partial [Candidatus Kapabacteria bacterium]|nr:hypothetical protein [Candidatus Kapabacteria bacterium]